VIEAMPRPRPPHLQRQVTQHGKAVWYVRIGKGPRIRIRADFGTPEFDAEYQAAISGTPRPKKGAPATGTLAWLVARYREVSEWTSLSPATRKQRENILVNVLETAGDKPFVKIAKATIVAGCERRAKTPAQARHFLTTMRGLFGWATKAGLAKNDPTTGIETPRQRKAKDLSPGPKSTLKPTSSVGRSARGSAFGLTCCSTLACAGAMRCASDDSTSGMASARSRRKKAGSRSPLRCRSCRCWLRHWLPVPAVISRHCWRARSTADQRVIWQSVP
jgi:hypothetical protein